jgi:molybdopterin-guanine dinucleotide biosynthesis protein A
MHAVITAGGTVGADFARAIGTSFKALAPLGKHRLIDPALEAARAIDVSAIALVAPPAVADYCASRADIIVAAATDGGENILRALRAFPQAERLLLLTSDMPFIDAASLSVFIERSRPSALTMALAPAAAYAAEYPAAPPHSVTLGGQRFANGSAFVIDRAAIAPLERLAGRFFAARKSLPRLGALLGPALCLRFALGRLSIADIERRAGNVLGITARAVVEAAPALCYDVDDIADWTYANSLAAAYG